MRRLGIPIDVRTGEAVNEYNWRLAATGDDVVNTGIFIPRIQWVLCPAFLTHGLMRVNQALNRRRLIYVLASVPGLPSTASLPGRPFFPA
jgi:hypothetical protein